MVIYSPDDVKRCERKENDEFEQSFTLKHIDCHKKKNTGGKKKQIIEMMSFHFFFNMISHVFHKLDNGAFCGN